MKLEISLPCSPSVVHFLPILDLLALLMMFPLLGSSFVKLAGLSVTMHHSPWRYQQMENAVVITLGAGEDHPIWVNKKKVPFNQLEDEIVRLQKADDGSSITSAVLRTDVGVPSGIEKTVVDRILKMGLKCGIVGPPAKKE